MTVVLQPAPAQRYLDATEKILQGVFLDAIKGLNAEVSAGRSWLRGRKRRRRHEDKSVNEWLAEFHREVERVGVGTATEALRCATSTVMDEIARRAVAEQPKADVTRYLIEEARPIIDPPTLRIA